MDPFDGTLGLRKLISVIGLKLCDRSAAKVRMGHKNARAAVSIAAAADFPN
jgi:hypothetical protein